MKKVYLAPQTEAMKLMVSTVLMASPGARFIPTGDAVSGEYGD